LFADRLPRPAAQVVSGTDSGSLLVWEGNFIKFRLVRPRGELCHAGPVTSVVLLRDPRGSGRGAQLVSGGADGKLCWWDFKAIDEVRAAAAAVCRRGGTCGDGTAPPWPPTPPPSPFSFLRKTRTRFIPLMYFENPEE
jgi:hypothetical protein